MMFMCVVMKYQSINSMLQDAVLGSSVYKVSATDPDLGLNGLVNYNISVSGTNIRISDFWIIKLNLDLPLYISFLYLFHTRNTF